MKFFKKAYIFLLACAFASLLTMPFASALEPPGIVSSNIVLADTVTNTVFYSKDADARVYPASLTKIMTIMLTVEAIEDGVVSLGDEVTATENMTFDLIEDGSTAGIRPGETMTLENLMYCAMLKSANEACNVIAEYIGGSISNFISMMNDKARELGCTGTLFSNTYGAPDENHYTTAWDMYLIASQAMTHPLFAEISSTVYREVPATNLSDTRYLVTTNGLLSDEAAYTGYYYEYAAGVKTGYTNAAGYCLVSTAAKDDLRLMAVVMGGVAADITGEDGQTTRDYSSFSDSIGLYEWGFNNWSYQEIIKTSTLVAELPVEMGADADRVTLRAQSPITALLPNDTNMDDFKREITLYSERDGITLTAPVTAGDVLGEITISRDGRVYGSVNLIAATSVDLSKIFFIRTEIQNALDRPVVKTVFWLLVLLFAGYLVLVIRYRVRRIRHQRRVRMIKKQRARQMAESESARYDGGPPYAAPYMEESAGTDAGHTRAPSNQTGLDESDDDFLDQLFK